MTGRQQHTKSRRGCLSCKRRHLKCDEQGPPCANCRVRRCDCIYGAAVHHSSPAPLAATPSSSSLTPFPANRRLELELFHQWSTDTYRSLVFYAGDDNIWQVAVPQMALDHDYLLNAVLAMSALHLSTISASSQSRSYQLAALDYQNLAIAAFQAEDRQPSSELSQPLFAFSVINLVLAVAIPSYLDRKAGQATIVDNLATVFKLLRGIVSIYTSGKNWLLRGSFGSFIVATAVPHTEEIPPHRKAAFARLRAIRDKYYAAHVASAGSPLDAVYLYESTTKAIESLEVCFRICSENKLAMGFRWLAMLEAGLVEMISNLEPFALLLTMHWAVLLEELSSDRWWARSSGKALVAEIFKILSVQKPEWLPEMTSIYVMVGLPPPDLTSVID